jgi:C-terminal processing protease CtpA/Prc
MNYLRKRWLAAVLTAAVLVPLLSLAFFSKDDTPQDIKNIETFARLYGYVKYFHPSDEASNIDWNLFAVYGVKQVEKAKNSRELKKILDRLFLPLAPTMEIYHTGEKKEFQKSRIIPPNTKNKKVIAWQHHGLGLSSMPNIYQSIRLNRKVKARSQSPIGNLMLSLPAKPYQGKEFIFKAAVKADSGKAQLWFRVDRLNRKVGFFDNMGDRPIQADQWKTYEIKGTIDEDANTINFWCFLLGDGEIYVDDFQLLVNEGGKWKSTELKNPGFEEDAEGQAPRHWYARGNGYDIKMTTATASTGKNSVLITAKLSEGPAVPLFHRSASTGEHIRKKLGSGLSCFIPLALYGTETQTYPAAPDGALGNLKRAVKNGIPQKLTAADPYVRKAGVVIAWNVFQHFYPYFDVVKVDWNKVFTETLVQAAADANEKDFLKTMQKMIAQLQDGHGNVYHPLLRDRAGFPFKVDWIEYQVVITVSQDKLFKRGDVILSIDGIDAEKALLEAETYISGSLQWKRVRSLGQFGWGPKDSTAVLKINRDGRVMEITASRSFNGQIKEFHRPCIEELAGNIFYVDLDNSRAEQEVSANIQKLANAKGVIFDARGYVKFGRQMVLSYLADKTLTSPMWNIPRVIYPDRQNFIFTASNWKVEPKKPRIKGKVVFLTGSGAISASETFMGMVEHYKLGEIVGRATAGTNGNVNIFDLPGGYRVFWTGMRVLKHDGSRHHLIGIRPTVPVKRTLKGIKEGRDECLDRALKLINPVVQ